jgi:hypothetical protein
LFPAHVRSEKKAPKNAPAAAAVLIAGGSPAPPRFTDKPIRRAGAFETSYFTSSDTFVSEGSWLGAPNAALTGINDGKPYVVIVTLYNPQYNNATNTLQYQVMRQLLEHVLGFMA